MNILEINNIRKSFDNFDGSGKLEVLKDISLSVKEGEVVSILGPSGSGKSTLLRCATLLETMDGGSLSYCGEAVAKDVNGISVYSPKSEIKKIKSYFGLVFQNFNLFPHFTVLKNVTDAPISVQKRDKAQVYKEARELLEQMSIGDKENFYPGQLSGGQQQRVAIARALALKPQMLFFDEPTSALDPELTQDILKVIRQLAAQKMTMVIVTHEIEFARNVSDRVIFMENGYIVEEGDPKDVIDNPKNDRVKAFLQKIKN
ncbi:MAG: amino acid ABC transporter ATP-binding protein [Oscillospiraceae bacterium]|nr:amino acid ABC transporter ATP-binding protein [Oscillospiraceae bacterium]